VALALKRQGITKVRPLAGGLQAWIELGYPFVQENLIALTKKENAL